MTVYFAAVHTHEPWRIVTKHETHDAALSGRDGAENLLRNIGRAAMMNRRYGLAKTVLVWKEMDTHAVAMRLRTGCTHEIDRIEVPITALARFKHKVVGPSPEQIMLWFAGLALPLSLSDHTDDPNKGSALPPSSTYEIGPAGQYLYGSKPTWEIALDAVRELGRPVSNTEVGELIIGAIPHFKRSNLAADLSLLSVNCKSRGNYAVNRQPRRTDTHNRYDRLLRVGTGRSVRFALYDPSVHGVWELADVGDNVLRPRFLASADVSEMEQARCALEADEDWDPGEDARQRVLANVVRREGQPAFRCALLDAYGGACAITGCAVEVLLEAAHIMPYRGKHTNHVSNGLLLRADLHKLFDLHLFRIDPRSRTVHLSPDLRRSEYAKLDGAILRATADPAHAAQREALAYHQERCGWINASA